MRGSSSDEWMVGGVAPRRDEVGKPILLRVDDPLAWPNENWTGAVGSIVDRAVRKPGKAKPFWILGGVMTLLIATVGIEAWQAYAKPQIEQEIANLAKRFAHTMQVDCVGLDRNGARQDQRACR